MAAFLLSYLRRCCSPSSPSQLATWATAMPGIKEGHPCLFQTSRDLRSKPKLSVVLTKHMEGLGNAGQQVAVPAGFARNMLIPQGMALPAIPKYVKRVKEEMASAGMPSEPPKASQAEGMEKPEAAQPLLISREERRREAEQVARRLDAFTLSIQRPVPRKSTTLNEPVTKADIIREVQRQLNIQLFESNVELQTGITSLGSHEVPLRFPPSVQLPQDKEKLLLKLKLRRA